MVEVPEALLWGLRRYLAAANASISAIHRQPFRGGFSGSTLEYWRLRLRRAGVQSSITLVYKRGAVVPGAFMQGAPQREALAYANLPKRVAITMPTVVAVDIPAGDLWLLPFPPAKNTSHWLADWNQTDVEHVVSDMARLHLGFWNDRVTLEEWPWLVRPTGSESKILARDGLLGIDTMLQNGAFDDCITKERLLRLHQFAEDPTPLLAVLNDGAITLLHGDAGFQNIALTLDGRQRIWYDWQLVAAGCPAMDMVTLLHPWAYPDADPPLSISDLVAFYLTTLSKRGRTLNPDVFQHQLDAALIWRWICQWAPLLGQYSQRLKPEVRTRLYAVFDKLHWLALERL